MWRRCAMRRGSGPPWHGVWDGCGMWSRNRPISLAARRRRHRMCRTLPCLDARLLARRWSRLSDGRLSRTALSLNWRRVHAARSRLSVRRLRGALLHSRRLVRAGGMLGGPLLSSRGLIRTGRRLGGPFTRTARGSAGRRRHRKIPGCRSNRNRRCYRPDLRHDSDWRPRDRGRSGLRHGVELRERQRPSGIACQQSLLLLK